MAGIKAGRSNGRSNRRSNGHATLQLLWGFHQAASTTHFSLFPCAGALCVHTLRAGLQPELRQGDAAPAAQPRRDGGACVRPQARLLAAAAEAGAHGRAPHHVHAALRGQARHAQAVQGVEGLRL
eukprot:363422-Chlamydomonas_euryale.AAC.7